MKHIALMLKPASSLCNLRCRYCFYADISALRRKPFCGMMQPDTASSILTHVLAEIEPGGQVSFAFQGGEPTLAGLDFYKHFVREAARLAGRTRITYAFQTNGVLLDEAWCRFFHKNNFLVGLSLDGYGAAHNLNRVDEQGRGSFTQVMQAKRFLEAARVEYNLLCTLTNELARHPQQVWHFLLEQKIRYVQFTPCLGGMEGEQEAFALTPRRFCDFYRGLYPLWKRQQKAGNYISVKLFDDIVNLFVRREATACGIQGKCQLQYVVEADGSVYPCDFFVLDNFYIGNLAKTPLQKVHQNHVETGFMQSRPPLPKSCETCPYQTACHGGCRRLAPHMCVGDDGFCGYRQLLDEIGEDLCHTGREMLGFT